MQQRRFDWSKKSFNGMKWHNQFPSSQVLLGGPVFDDFSIAPQKSELGMLAQLKLHCRSKHGNLYKMLD